MANREITAVRGTALARMSRERLIRHIQRGDIDGRRDKQLGWVVSEESLAAFVAARASAESRCAA